jgi:dTDP-glucose 4,6-dehydratase
VTGGAGFIGSNFVTYVLDRYPGIEVVNFDKLTYAGNLENLAHVADNSRYRFVQGDVADAEATSAVVREGVDAVVHFAAESHVDRSILGAAEFVRTNVLGTLTLLDAARAAKVSRFVHVSTDEVYGSLGDTGAFTEQTPLQPNSPYAASKAGSDLVVRSYWRTYGFPGIVTRCSNNYGPYQFPEKLIPLLVANAMAGIPLPIYGDGLYVRDWIHVRDHCAALDRILHHGEPGEVYNIGARQEMRNLDVARMVLEAFGLSDDALAWVTDRPGHDRRYAIDPGKIERELGWRARIDFREGLGETIAWYRSNPQWIEEVRSGAYLGYYDRMYRNRRKTLSEI